MKMKLLFKSVILTILLITTNVVMAQQSDDYGYNEDDYDGDYEYNSYNNSYYQRGTEDEYRKRQERFYKKSYEEEDLYNGGYRRKNYSSSESYYGIGGLNMGGINARSKSWFGGNDDDENTPIVKQRNIDGLDNREVGIIEGVDRIGGDGKGGVATKADPNQGKEITPGDDKKTETAPPPPDEPDIPVDTAIPFLIAAGLLIATLKLNKIKNALVN
jgi:hypothetical protein